MQSNAKYYPYGGLKQNEVITMKIKNKITKLAIVGGLALGLSSQGFAALTESQADRCAYIASVMKYIVSVEAALIADVSLQLGGNFSDQSGVDAFGTSALGTNVQNNVRKAARCTAATAVLISPAAAGTLTYSSTALADKANDEVQLQVTLGASSGCSNTGLHTGLIMGSFIDNDTAPNASIGIDYALFIPYDNGAAIFQCVKKATEGSKIYRAETMAFDTTTS
jgi:hypothetical protein